MSDEENFLLNRPYCGNPFIAPGTIGAKSGQKRDSGFEDERFFFDQFNISMPDTASYMKQPAQQQSSAF